MALYLERLSLVNVTESTAVDMVNVMEGVNGSVVFGYNTENTTVKTGSNRTQIVATSHTLDLMAIDDQALASQFTEWANTPEFNFKVVGYSGDTFLLWDEPTTLTFPRQYDQIVTRKVKLTCKAVSGYSGVQPLVKVPVYAGGNLLALYKCYEGNASLLNGLQVSGTMVTSQSAGSQTITRGGDFSAYLLSQPLLFPFPTATLTASITTTAHTGDGALGFRFLDDSLNQISLTTTTFVGSGTVRRTFSAVVPALTRYVQLVVVAGTTLANATTFNSPMIGLNYNSVFTT
jgi:hypothetical protein